MAITGSFFHSMPKFFQRQVRAASIDPQDIPLDALSLPGDESEEKDTFNHRSVQGAKAPTPQANPASGIDTVAKPGGLMVVRSAFAGLSNVLPGLSEPCRNELPRLAMDTLREQSNSQGNNNNTSGAGNAGAGVKRV
jgi:hypothetical protein